MLAPGIFEWTSPHGHLYRRDRTGTTRSTRDPPDDLDPAPNPATHGAGGAAGMSPHSGRRRFAIALCAMGAEVPMSERLDAE